MCVKRTKENQKRGRERPIFKKPTRIIQRNKSMKDGITRDLITYLPLCACFKGFLCSREREGQMIVSRVTRWLDFLSKSGHLQQSKFAKSIQILTKWVKSFAKYSLKKYPRRFKFCKSGEFSSNLVTLDRKKIVAVLSQSDSFNWIVERKIILFSWVNNKRSDSGVKLL